MTSLPLITAFIIWCMAKKNRTDFSSYNPHSLHHSYKHENANPHRRLKPICECQTSCWFWRYDAMPKTFRRISAARSSHSKGPDQSSLLDFEIPLWVFSVLQPSKLSLRANFQKPWADCRVMKLSWAMHTIFKWTAKQLEPEFVKNTAPENTLPKRSSSPQQDWHPLCQMQQTEVLGVKARQKLHAVNKKT